MDLEQQSVDLVIHYLCNPATNPYGGSVPVEKIRPSRGRHGTPGWRQNIIYTHHRTLYHHIGAMRPSEPDTDGRMRGTHRNAWQQFLTRHRPGTSAPQVGHVRKRDTFAWFQCPVTSLQRLRLRENEDWYEADIREREDRQAFGTRTGRGAGPRCQRYVLATLLRYILRSGPCTVDAFMTAYPQLSFVVRDPDGQTLVPLPRRAQAGSPNGVVRPPVCGDFVRLIRRHPDVFVFDRNTFRVALVADGSNAAAAHLCA